MSFWEIFLTGVGLSADAFAVALCKGLKMRRINYPHALLTALFFGVFQALMPLIGWAVGSRFADRIEAYDHWIAFGLLAAIGAKMIVDAVRGGDDETKDGEKINIPELFALAFATSVDALAVGVAFAFTDVSLGIGGAAALIGATTFALSFAGVAVGNRFGSKYKNRAGICGGVVLVLIGARILLDGLGVKFF